MPTRPLHPLAERFASVAEAYDYGRPEYPPEVVAELCAELGVRAGDPVLDLGAGTGKLTLALLAAGLEVVAVEPQAELRAILVRHLEDPGTRVLDALAEELPLDDGSFAAVTVADAFHWFDRPRALAEIARILRPCAPLAILDKEPDWEVATWGAELAALLDELRPAHPHFSDPPWYEFVRASGLFDEPRIVKLRGTVPLVPDRVLAHVASMSWIAALPRDDRERTLARVAAMMREGQTPASMPVEVEAGIARRLDPVGDA